VTTQSASVSQRPRWLQGLLFALIGFGPLLLAAGILLAGILLNLWIMIAEAAKPYSQDVALFGLAGVGIPAVLFVAIALGFWGFRRTKSWLTGSLVLYGLWFVLAFLLFWLLASALAGASMAVADGVAQTGDVRRDSLKMAGSLLVFAQVGIVPWAFGAAWLLRRLGR